jgi:hypothetical protein
MALISLRTSISLAPTLHMLLFWPNCSIEKSFSLLFVPNCHLNLAKSSWQKHHNLNAGIP